MSERAIVWAQEQRARTATAKFLLMRLAAYADAEGIAWAFVERLAAEMQTSDRTVQRCLRSLEVDRLIVRTGKFKCRNVPFYRLDVERPSARTVTPASPLNGDTSVTVGHANGDMGVTPNGDTGVTPKQGNPSSVEDKSSPSERACAGEAQVQAEGFEDGWAAYPELGKRGVSSDRLGRPAWAEEVADGADPSELVEACRVYAADRTLWGSSGKPKAFHNFLKSGVWKGLKGSAGKGSGASSWAGPAEVRTAFVAARSEDWAVGYLDRSAWREADQTILAWSGRALDKIAQALPGLPIVGLKVELKGKA